MHACNLGIYHIINCEGLVMLGEFRSKVWGCTLGEALLHLWDDFRDWCAKQKISCSHRRWSLKHLHLKDQYGTKQFGHLVSKAYNARVILGWLADSRFSVKNESVCFSLCFFIFFLGVTF